MPDHRSLADRLINISGLYGAAAIPQGIPFGKLAVIGLVGRARRLVPAIHHSIDAGDALEAQIFVRALVEYAITLPWMALDPDLHLKQWLIEDIRLTLVMDDELRRAGEPLLEDANRATLERLREDLRADCGDRPTAMPSAKDRASAIGASLLYSWLIGTSRRAEFTRRAWRRSSSSARGPKSASTKFAGNPPRI